MQRTRKTTFEKVVAPFTQGHLAAILSNAAAALLKRVGGAANAHQFKLLTRVGGAANALLQFRSTAEKR